MGQYFGTDGIRGLTNTYPMTPGMAMRVGQAAGRKFLRGSHKHRVVVGKDPRLSGYMLESAMIAGFTSVGMDIVMVGPLPTPAVAMLTRSMRADLGVMISASHNAFHDNGIKFFGPDGFKLSDEDEADIERLLDIDPKLAEPSDIGRSKMFEDARGRYIHNTKLSFPSHLRLDELHVVVDCANGAAYTVAPDALWELGADVTKIGVEPNGFNINDGVGSTKPELLQKTVVEKGADIGIALDGDADRLIVVDEKGNIIDGDQLMALVTTDWARKDMLRGGGLVATVMSNLGLERYLEANKLQLARTKVGDRYVLEHMRKHGYNVGGEQSGHMIMTDYATTGDGLVAALQILAVLVASGKPASELLSVFDPVPQLLQNVRYQEKDPLEEDSVKAAISDAEAKLGNTGRVLIRKSGTEPVIRVMAEGDDPDLVKTLVGNICEAVEKAA